MKSSSLKSEAYFCLFAGFAGVLCDDPTPDSTDPGPFLREAMTDSVIEVTIKIMAHQVVALVSMVAAPRGPKAVWLPMPRRQQQCHRFGRSAAAQR